jgi:hypothetical protein
MYIKPGYTPPATSPPPVDAGRRLLTLPRHDGELRISISQYQGNDYLSIRVWEPGAYDPGLYPTKKGVSIRISEIDHVLSALEHAREIVEGERPREDRRREGPAEKQVIISPVSHEETPRYVPPRHGGHRHRPPFDPTPLKSPGGAAENFDEFHACGTRGEDRDRDASRGTGHG